MYIKKHQTIELNAINLNAKAHLQMYHIKVNLENEIIPI